MRIGELLGRYPLYPQIDAVRIERAATIPDRPGADVALTNRGAIKDPMDV